MKEITIAMILLTTREVLSMPAVRPIQSRNARVDNGEDSYNDQQSGPYPPSGWAPSGNLLLVPGETHSSQQQNGYGPPPPPPNNQYGPVETTTAQVSTTTESQIVEEPDSSEGSSQLQRPAENGQYYVLLPDGKLQRVQYSGKQRGKGQYEAQVQYEEVEPVRPPLFSYQDFSLPLQF